MNPERPAVDARIDNLANHTKSRKPTPEQFFSGEYFPKQTQDD